MNFQLSDYHKALMEAASRLARSEFSDQAFTWDKRGEYPFAYLKTLANYGFSGIALPEEYGGQGGSLLDAVLVIETIAQICPNAGDCVQALNFGAIQQVARLGWLTGDPGNAFAAPACWGRVGHCGYDRIRGRIRRGATEDWSPVRRP